MNLAMVARIVFPEREGRKRIEITKVTGVKIESGWEMLTDTATILLARNVKFFDKYKVKEVFKKGDAVQIYLGYDVTLVKEFTGYITEVSADVPIKIKCEDAMYLLKRHPVNLSLKDTTLKNLLTQILPKGFKVDPLEIELGTVRYAKTTAAKVLEQIKSDYGLHSYIKNHDTLVCGKIYQDDVDEAVNFNFNKNIVSNNLNYKSKDEIFVLIKAVSTLKKGAKLEVEVGDTFGVTKQLTYYNITSVEALTALAQQDYDKFKVDGFDGSFEAFGIPSITHGQKVHLIDPDYPEKNGVYWTKKVIKTYDDSPKYRQSITLDQKITT